MSIGAAINDGLEVAMEAVDQTGDAGTSAQAERDRGPADGRDAMEATADAMEATNDAVVAPTSY